MRSPSTHMVKVLNLNEMKKNAVLFLIGNGYDMNAARLTAQFAPIGLVTDMNGKHYLIDNEGCGSGVALEDEKDTIGWCKDTYNKDGTLATIGCYPIMESHVDYVDVMGIPVEKVIRLDEFVRVFGDRLDRNCGNWDRFLSGLIDKEGKRIKSGN